MGRPAMSGATPPDAERAAVIADGLRRREQRQDPASMRGLDLIDIEVVDVLTYEAHGRGEPDALMRVGEPVERGGTGAGASPLSHFLTGVGACLMNQVVRVAISEAYPLTVLGTSVRGEFRREAGGAFERIACRLRADGTLTADVARHLVERAEKLCYIHRTLVHAVEMTTILVLNGEEIVRRTDGPDREVRVT